MAFLAVDKNTTECIYNEKPVRSEHYSNWMLPDNLGEDGCFIMLPTGSIKKLIGRLLSWEDEPVEIK